jgi:hypothetical protein
MYASGIHRNRFQQGVLAVLACLRRSEQHAQRFWPVKQPRLRPAGIEVLSQKTKGTAMSPDLCTSFTKSIASAPGIHHAAEP